ncbi:MAG: ABC transporter permease [Gemmatimonadota bacterium]|nr:ABC transporter permease [Gemmatimonadota bacterium]
MAPSGRKDQGGRHVRERLRGGDPLARYAVRRLLGAIPLLWGIVTLLFILLHLAPGDPATAYFNPNVDPEVIEQMRRNFGLDRPLHEQYLRWLASFVTGEFGFSFSRLRPVGEVLADALPNTLWLGGASLLVIFTVGCGIGIAQAVRQHSKLDHGLTFAALFLYSVPTFWLGVVLVLWVSSDAWPDALRLPISGMRSLDYASLGPLERVADRLRHLILPTIALGLSSAAAVARFMRGAMLETIDQDYVRTARAKGLSERRVILAHAARNALIPIVSLFGLFLPILFGGAVVVEVIFAWPGMGRLMYDAIGARDYPLVMAGSFLFAALVIAANLVADLLYAVIDPRVRYR